MSLFHNLLMFLFFYKSPSLDGSDCNEQFRQFVLVAKHQVGLQLKGKVENKTNIYI